MIINDKNYNYEDMSTTRKIFWEIAHFRLRPEEEAFEALRNFLTHRDNVSIVIEISRKAASKYDTNIAMFSFDSDIGMTVCHSFPEILNYDNFIRQLVQTAAFTESAIFASTDYDRAYEQFMHEKRKINARSYYKYHKEKVKEQANVNCNGDGEAETIKIKQMYKEKVNFTCERCGRHDSGAYLHVHHIKPTKILGFRDNSEENLVCLCNSCHQQLHKGIIRDDNDLDVIVDKSNKFIRHELKSCKELREESRIVKQFTIKSNKHNREMIRQNQLEIHDLIAKRKKCKDVDKINQINYRINQLRYEIQVFKDTIELNKKCPINVDVAKRV